MSEWLSLVRAYRQAHVAEIIQELVELVRIPNNVYVVPEVSSFDCNQHTADENLHLKQFFQSIDIYAAVLLSEETTGTAGNI